MKTKILFIGQSLKVGGIERALVEQINGLDTDRYDIYLLLFYKGGEYLSNLSTSVHLIESNMILSCMAMTNMEAKRNVFTFLTRSSMYVLSRLLGNRLLYLILFRFIKPVGDFDVCVSYFHDVAPKGLYYGCNLFALRKVSAKKKIAWIHSDCEFANIGSADNRELFKQFDAVVNVSNAMKRKFDKLGIIPKEHSKVVYNRSDQNGIKKLSTEYNVPRVENIPVLVTVGRLEPYKSTMELLKVAKQLKEYRLNFVWYFVGDGCLHFEAKEYIVNNNLSDNVVLTGQLANPYPYISNADLFVSGSVTETFGLSILEALYLGAPVVAYRYDAINELIEDGVNGIVIDTFDEMFKKLENLLIDNEQLKNLKKQARSFCDYNELNRKQIMEIFDYDS